MLKILDRSLLEKEGWNCESLPSLISNEKTGCKISGNFVQTFLIQKIEELKEDMNSESTIYPTDEVLLKNEGMYVICESPFEIVDNNENMITGECAHWLIAKLKESYLKSMK
jgi:hypothetical protein